MYLFLQAAEAEEEQAEQMVYVWAVAAQAAYYRQRFI
jgi:tRNA splicing endonuclease